MKKIKIKNEWLIVTVSEVIEVPVIPIFDCRSHSHFQ